MSFRQDRPPRFLRWIRQRCWGHSIKTSIRHTARFLAVRQLRTGRFRCRQAHRRMES
jgi:hypothetical protein